MGEACMATFWPIPGLKWRTFVTVPGFQVGTWISKSVCMGKELSQLAAIKINLRMSIGVWRTLPIFLPVYLHVVYNVMAQLTYPFTFIKLHVRSHNYFQMQVHLHVDLVYLFFSITGIVATPIPIHSTTSLVNKLETPIYTHIYIYIIC